ncbi:hypothetical protein [Paenibacillus sp. Z6-24]
MSTEHNGESLIQRTLYPGSSVAFHTGGDQQVGEAILQYEETDWALTKRLASRLQTVIVCDMLKSVKPRLHFGLPEGKQVHVPDNVPYTARKDLKAYQQAGGSAAGLHDTDFFRYELQHIEPFEIGDRVTFRDKKLVVREVHAVMEKGQLLFNYVLSREHGVRSLLITNPKAIGVSLEGTVLAVRGEEVKLKLDVDKDDGKADPHWYPFAPPTGSPMYSMPQVGTKATLYHPDGTGTRAQIIGSVRTNGASAPKTSDPNIRYYGSEHGSELKMAPDHVHIHGNPAGTMAISLEDGVGVTIRSPKKLTITGKEDIVLFSKKKVIIQAGEQIMAYKTGGTSGISIEGEYHLLGENVWADGSDRTAYAAYQDEPQKGTPPPPPDPPKPFDWGKLGRNVLGGLAIVVGVAALAAFTVATLGAGPLIVGAVAVGAAAAGSIAVGVQAASDIARGEVSDFGEYATTALRESLIGAVTGAIFGPLGVGGSIAGKMALGGAENAISDIASQMLQGKKFSELDWKSVGMSAGLGVATVGVVNSKAGKALGGAIADGVGKATPQFVKNGVKASGEAFQNSLSKLNDAGSKLGQKMKNGLENMTSPAYVTPDGTPIRMSEPTRMESRSIPETEVQRNYKRINREEKIDTAKDFAREQLEEHVKFLKNGGIKKPVDKNGHGGGKYKPDVISAAVDITTLGSKETKIRFGYNGAREGQFNPSVMELHDDLVKIVKETRIKAKNDPNNPYKEDESFEIWHVENCAEIQAVNQLLHSGSKLEDILISTINGNGKYKAPCKNCQKTFFDFINDFRE